MKNQISLEDLSIVVSMIDACSIRGAFKGDELATVGRIREKFSEIIKENLPEENKEKEESE